MKTTFTLFSLVFCLQFGLAQTAYINGGPVSVVNSSTLTVVDSIDLHGYTPQIASNSDGSTIVITTFFNTYMIDASTNNVADSIEGFTSNSVAGNAPEQMFGVRSGTFYEINLTTKAIDSLVLPNTDRIQRRPGTDEVWVCADSTIHVIDISAGMSLASSFVSGSSQYDGSEVRFTSDGATAIKLNWNSKTVAKIDAATKTVSSVLDMSFTPNLAGVEVSADGSLAFVSASGSNMLYKIDASTMTLSDSVEMPNPPFGIYRHPNSGKMWVVGHFDDIVYIVNPSDMAIEDSILVRGNPHIVAFVNTATGVTTVDSPELSLYPNPTSNQVFVSGLNPGATWELLDISGRLISKGMTKTSIESVDVAGLQPGAYIFQSGDLVSKLIKQ